MSGCASLFAAPPTLSHRSGKALDGEPISVLLVDDDHHDMVTVLKALSESREASFTIERATDAPSALAALCDNRHDVCLMGLRADGMGLLREARSAGADVPVIVLTRGSDPGADVAAMDGGAADFLEKDDIDARLLYRAIRHAIARARYERELAGKNERLERLDAEKNRLLGMAAHDLRNPLGVVYGYASLLNNDLDRHSPDEVREIVRIIVRSARFMRGLIDDLLDFASIELGTLRLSVVATDPAELARRNVALNQIHAAAKAIVIGFEAEAALPFVAVDSARFDQVLDNLLSNALKHSERGASVRVRVRASEGLVYFDVIDRGRGIAQDSLSRIFAPFPTEGTKGTAGEKSTGLGLAIVKRIVDAHGGCLDVRSELGHGSTFSVGLPTHFAGVQ